MHNNILLAACVFVGIQTVSGSEVEIQSLVRECETKGIEKQEAQALINALTSNRKEAIQAIGTLSSKKLARPISQGLWNLDDEVKRQTIENLLKLKDPTATSKVIQALEENIRMRDGSDTATAHEAFVIDLVKLLNVLTGSNYQLDIYNDTEARRKEIIKAAKEKLAKQKELTGDMSQPPTNQTAVVVPEPGKTNPED